jgi:hypothetical protein
MRVHRIVPALLLMAAALPAADSLLPDGKPIAVAGDLGSKRANWTTAVWAKAAYAQPRDLRAFGGVAVTVTGAPRTDIELAIALQEADGTWRYHQRACPLSAASNRAEVRFADFVPAEWLGLGSHNDENHVLDLDAIAAVAVGVVQPFGGGTVNCSVTALDLLPVVDQKTAPAAVQVTGRMIDINGTTILPAGVFGAFNVPKDTWERYRLTLDRRIDHGGGFNGAPPKPRPGMQIPIFTVGDRGVPSPLLADPSGWKGKLTAAATAAVTKTGGGAVVEFWNEPYLNWSNKNRVAFQNRFYDESKAAEGATVRLKDGSEMPHLKWTQRFEAMPWTWFGRFDGERDNWRRGKDANGKVWSLLYEPPHWESKARKDWLPQTHPPKAVPDGGTYTATIKGKNGDEQLQLTAFTPWRVYDETQFTFWSASGMSRAYDEPMRAVGEAIKAADPKATYIIGWCSRPTEDHLAAWHLAYRPSIDAAGTLADAVNDHDYGGDPTRMDASAELVAAYSATKHGKMLRSINTETSAAADPEAYPGGKADPAGANRVKFRFTARKLVSALARQPDKMMGFAFSGDGDGAPKSYFSPAGEGIAFDLLMQLRGRLVQAVSGDPDIRVVAAVDGTDPMNPRPAALGDKPVLTVAVLNDHSDLRPVTLTVAAPAGTTFAAGAVERRAGDGIGAPSLTDKPLPATGGSTTWTGTIPGEDIVVLQLPLSKAPADGVQARRIAQFSPVVATTVTPVKPYATTIACSPEAVDLAKRPGARTWLRLAVENVAAGEAIAVVGGTELPIPAVVGGDNGCWLVELPLPVSVIAASVPVQVKIVDPARTAGFILASATIYIEGDR